MVSTNKAIEWQVGEVRGGYQVRSSAEAAGEFLVSEVKDVCFDCVDGRAEGSAIPITWLGSACSVCGRRIVPG